MLNLSDQCDGPAESSCAPPPEVSGYSRSQLEREFAHLLRGFHQALRFIAPEDLATLTAQEIACRNCWAARSGACPADSDFCGMRIDETPQPQFT